MRVWKKENEYRLFKLFYTDNLRDNILQWTKTRCGRVGETQVTKNDLDTFIGLEMAIA